MTKWTEYIIKWNEVGTAICLYRSRTDQGYWRAIHSLPNGEMLNRETSGRLEIRSAVLTLAGIAILGGQCRGEKVAVHIHGEMIDFDI